MWRTIAALAVALAVALLVDAPALGGPAVFLLVVLAELVGATLLVVARARTPGPSVDRRPADGEVPLVGLPGVEGTPNEADPSIRSFTGALPDAAPARPRPPFAQRPLLGRVGLFSLFIGRDGSAWSDREVAEAFGAARRMGRWIEREAIRWGAPVNLELIDTYVLAEDPAEETVALTAALDPYRVIVDEADADVRGVASASRAAARLGFRDLADLIGRLDPRADHDLTVWFVHLLRAGRSSAIAPDRFRYPGVGLALCYARESSASEPLAGLPFVDPVTLAHELLHLFGATDKYGTSLASFPRGSVTSRDVMRLDRTRLSGLEIGPLTAAEVGWTSPGNEKRPASTRSRRRAVGGDR